MGAKDQQTTTQTSQGRQLIMVGPRSKKKISKESVTQILIKRDSPSIGAILPVLPNQTKVGLPIEILGPSSEGL